MGMESRVEALRPWHYQFDLDGVITPIYRPDTITRHPERKRIGFDPFVRAMGGLSGKRVLDLGSNAGWWSLAALDAGAEFVLGVDGRQKHIDQANLVFETKGVDPERYRFELGNIFTHDFQSFDVVLCLGLMYHIAKPVELFEIFSRVDASYVLIDTHVSLIPTSAFRVALESLDSPRNAIDYEMTLIPSRQAMRDLAAQFGYETAILAPNVENWTAMEGYRQGTRAMFICSKTPVDVEREAFSNAQLLLSVAKRNVKRALRHRKGRRSSNSRKQGVA
jgi:tRNA (mo5U34)-methyltransferase